MVLYLLLWLSVVSGVWCTGPPPPVDFDIDRMVGRFYVVYMEYKLGVRVYKNNTYCKTNDYIKVNETTLALYINDNIGSPSVTPYGGYAGTVTKTDTNSLVFLDVRRSKSSESNVVKLGEDGSSSDDSQYDYFIQLNRENRFWAKVKDLETFNEVYKSEIDAFLEEYGFAVYVFPHNCSCNYAEPPTGSGE